MMIGSMLDNSGLDFRLWLADDSHAQNIPGLDHMPTSTSFCFPFPLFPLPHLSPSLVLLVLRNPGISLVR